MPPSLPYLSADIPGVGGQLRTCPEDFRVVEVPAYEACGQGDHVLCMVEKRGLTTFEMIRLLAAAVGVAEDDVGVAGMKDKHAVTTQQVSLPPPTTPEAALAVDVAGVKVLSAARHTNKLKTGHLRANRFEIVIRDLSVPVADAHARAQAVLELLSRPPGAANWFGEQRFGRGGDTAEQGRRLVSDSRWRGPRGRKRRLFISAFQSLLFNDYLLERIDAGLYRSVVAGDIAQIHGHAKSFAVVDVDAEQARLDAGEIAITGPIFGHQMRQPADGTRAWELEKSILDRHSVSLESFAHLRKLAMGTRRPLSVPLADAATRIDDDGQLVVAFSLPSGSYATAILGEIQKSGDNE